MQWKEIIKKSAIKSSLVHCTTTDDTRCQSNIIFGEEGSEREWKAVGTTVLVMDCKVEAQENRLVQFALVWRRAQHHRWSCNQLFGNFVPPVVMGFFIGLEYFPLHVCIFSCNVDNSYSGRRLCCPRAESGSRRLSTEWNCWMAVSKADAVIVEGVPFLVACTAAATRSLQSLVWYCCKDRCMSLVSLRRVSFNKVFIELVVACETTALNSAWPRVGMAPLEPTSSRSVE